MTYEGVFFQEQHDDMVRNKEDDDLGYVDLDPNDDDTQIDGEAVVNQRDIIILEKLMKTLTMRKSLHLRQTTKKICVIVMMRPIDK